jgi:hypothetical protein
VGIFNFLSNFRKSLFLYEMSLCLGFDQCAVGTPRKEIIDHIMNNKPYLCSMCNSCIKCLTWYNSSGTTLDNAHAKAFHDKNIHKVCKHLKKINKILHKDMYKEYKRQREEKFDEDMTEIF